MIWPVVVGIGDVEVFVGFAAAEGFVGTDVGEHVVPDRHVGEVDDQVGPLGQTHEEPVAVGRGQVHRGGEEPAFVADRPHLDAGNLVEVDDEEPGLAPVEQAEAVAALLDGQERPGVAVDHDHVAEELRVPDRRDVGVGDVWAGDAVEERPGVGVEERPVGVERPVLDGDGDLPVGLVRWELVVLAGRRPRQRRGESGAAVDDGAVALGPASDDEEPGRPGVHVEPSHAQGVVVIPGRRRPAEVRVLEDGEPRAPGGTEAGSRLGLEEVIPGALGGEAGGDVVGGRQVPRLGVAVALVAHAHGAVCVGDDGHRARVRAGRRR